MGRRNRSSGGRWVQLPHWMLASEAWRSLAPPDVVIFVELARLYNGANNGKIHLSVREAAEKIHGSPATASRALARLTERGFIVPVVKGAFSLKLRHATEWLITAYPSSDTQPASMDFMRWRPAEKIKHGTCSETVGASGETVRCL
jgi:hypothetical protein